MKLLCCFGANSKWRKEKGRNESRREREQERNSESERKKDKRDWSLSPVLSVLTKCPLLTKMETLTAVR